jgi:hypothetical protein
MRKIAREPLHHGGVSGANKRIGKMSKMTRFRVWNGIAAMVVFTGIGAAAYACYQQPTYRALREFGWEGTWSRDCSDSSKNYVGRTQLVGRVHRLVPTFYGQATSIFEYEWAGEIEKAKPVTMSSARIVSENKLVVYSIVDSDDVVATTESVITKVGDKMVTNRSVTKGVAKRDLAAGRYAPEALKAGDHYEFQQVEDGVTKDFKGRTLGIAMLEKCRD